MEVKKVLEKSSKKIEEKEEEEAIMLNCYFSKFGFEFISCTQGGRYKKINKCLLDGDGPIKLDFLIATTRIGKLKF